MTKKQCAKVTYGNTSNEGLSAFMKEFSAYNVVGLSSCLGDSCSLLWELQYSDLEASQSHCITTNPAKTSSHREEVPLK